MASIDIKNNFGLMTSDDVEAEEDNVSVGV